MLRTQSGGGPCGGSAACLAAGAVAAGDRFLFGGGLPLLRRFGGRLGCRLFGGQLRLHELWVDGGQGAFPVVRQPHRPLRPKEAVHLAAVDGQVGRLPTMVQVPGDRRGMEMEGGLFGRASGPIGELRPLRNAVGPGKGAEVVIEGDVFLNDVDDVVQLDRRVGDDCRGGLRLRLLGRLRLSL